MCASRISLCSFLLASLSLSVFLFLPQRPDPVVRLAARGSSIIHLRVLARVLGELELRLLEDTLSEVYRAGLEGEGEQEQQEQDTDTEPAETQVIAVPSLALALGGGRGREKHLCLLPSVYRVSACAFVFAVVSFLLCVLSGFFVPL